MSHRAKYFAGLVVSMLALSIPGCHQSGDGQPQIDQLSGSAAGRNLILITVDTLRADRLGANGYAVQGRSPSPRIDALMSSGVHFAKTIAPRAITWPSLASVLTGLYPSVHGAYENGYELIDGIATLPTILAEQGYQTGRFLSNMCEANHLGWNQSFCSQGVDSKINPAALEWLDQIEPQKPFFLWVHYFGPHGPYYNGGERAAKELDPGYEGPVAPKKNWLNRIMTEEIALDEADIRHLDALYDAAVMGTDQFVDEMLSALDNRNLRSDSLLVFLADHGEELYDHNQYIYHACSVYQSGLHVPLAFIAPGILEEGKTVQQGAELIDVSPTILDLLGIATPGELHGISLVPFLEAERIPGGPRPVFSEYPPANIHTVQVGSWKLIDNPDQVSPYCLPDAPLGHYPLERIELYDLAEDPLETHNLADQYPEKVAQLQALIRQRFADLPTELVPQEVPEDLKKELEALGYVVN